MSDPVETVEPIVQEPTPQEKVFTQTEVSGMVAKESKKLFEKALKDIGIEDFENAKDGMKKLKEFQDAQKTESQKAIERATELENQLKTRDSEVNSYRNQLEMLKAGIPSDKLDRYSKLINTYEGDNLQDKIKLALEEFPLNPVVNTPNIGDKTKGEGQASTKEAMLAEIRKSMNLT